MQTIDPCRKPFEIAHFAKVNQNTIKHTFVVTPSAVSSRIKSSEVLLIMLYKVILFLDATADNLPLLNVSITFII